MKQMLRVSSGPHIHSGTTTQKIMLDVVIAMLPAVAGSIYFFGASAFILIAVSALSAVLAEYAWQKLTHQRVTITDFSAVVTGIMLAFNLPPTAPLWMPIIGSAFAIIVVKQLFGGLGHNFMNPALAARAVLMASWPARMNTFVKPSDLKALNLGFGASLFPGSIDAVSSATPMTLLKAGTSAAEIGIWDSFIGNVGGCLGETSALLLLIGGAYLLIRKVITLRTPASMLGTIAVMAFLFGGDNGLCSADGGTVLMHLFGGGAIMGAIFMASDYATSPVTPKGQIIYGIGIGLITMVIRLWGGYAEGTSYAILIMNVAAPLIERFTHQTPFGKQIVKKSKAKEEKGVKASA